MPCGGAPHIGTQDLAIQNNNSLVALTGALEKTHELQRLIRSPLELLQHGAQ